MPLPELCWLRDDSGVDLLPEGCAACDCVSLAGEGVDDGCDCRLPHTPERGDARWLLLQLFACQPNPGLQGDDGPSGSTTEQDDTSLEDSGSEGETGEPLPEG